MTIFGLEYQPFWAIVTILVCAFFGSLLWWIGYQIARLTDVIIERNKQEAEWRTFVDKSFYQESEGESVKYYCDSAGRAAMLKEDGGEL